MSGKEITGFRPGSTSWKKFMAKVYGWGGAVVIVGAMFKIQHWPGATVMLIGGLGIEAIIFILSAFEPLHIDPDWTLVYPELEIDDEHSLEDVADDAHGDSEKVIEEESLTVTEQLDNMLEEAKIGPELIQSLGEGLRGLSDQASKLSDVSNASVATNEYVDSMKNAASKVNDLSESYSQASESLGIMSVNSDQGGSFGEQMASISKNLGELNTIYELQLKGAQEQRETSDKFYGGLSELLENLNNSVDDTKRYRENIGELSNNLSSLNKVYGNMLQAMNPGSNA